MLNMDVQINPITIILDKIEHGKERKCDDLGIKIMQIIENDL